MRRPSLAAVALRLTAWLLLAVTVCRAHSYGHGGGYTQSYTLQFPHHTYRSRSDYHHRSDYADEPSHRTPAKCSVYQRGFSMAIPDTNADVKAIKFMGQCRSSQNQPLGSFEQIVRQPRNGYWTYANSDVPMNPGDTITYRALAMSRQQNAPYVCDENVFTVKDIEPYPEVIKPLTLADLPKLASNPFLSIALGMQPQQPTFVAPPNQATPKDDFDVDVGPCSGHNCNTPPNHGRDEDSDDSDDDESPARRGSPEDFAMRPDMENVHDPPDAGMQPPLKSLKPRPPNDYLPPVPGNGDEPGTDGPLESTQPAPKPTKPPGRYGGSPQAPNSQPETPSTSSNGTPGAPSAEDEPEHDKQPEPKGAPGPNGTPGPNGSGQPSQKPPNPTKPMKYRTTKYPEPTTPRTPKYQPNDNAHPTFLPPPPAPGLPPQPNEPKEPAPVHEPDTEDQIAQPDQPGNPVNPSNPVNRPGQPNKPGKQGNPANPSNPANQPGQPDKPGNPGNTPNSANPPSEPGKPGKPGNPSNPQPQCTGFGTACDQNNPNPDPVSGQCTGIDCPPNVPCSGVECKSDERFPKSPIVLPDCQANPQLCATYNAPLIPSASPACGACPAATVSPPECAAIGDQLNNLLQHLYIIEQRTGQLLDKVDTLEEVQAGLLTESNRSCHLLMKSPQVNPANAVREVRQIVSERLELPALRNSVLRAKPIESGGIVLTLRNVPDKLRILFRAQRRADVAHVVMEDFVPDEAFLDDEPPPATLDEAFALAFDDKSDGFGNYGKNSSEWSSGHIDVRFASDESSSKSPPPVAGHRRGY